MGKVGSSTSVTLPSSTRLPVGGVALRRASGADVLHGPTQIGDQELHGARAPGVHRGVEGVGTVLAVQVPTLGAQLLADREDVERLGVLRAEGHHGGAWIAAHLEPV